MAFNASLNFSTFRTHSFKIGLSPKSTTKMQQKQLGGHDLMEKLTERELYAYVQFV